MRKRIRFLLFPFLFIGCMSAVGLRALGPGEFQKGPTEAVFSHSFDEVWNTTLDALSDFSIKTVEKESGLVITDWKVQPRPFIFIGQPDIFPEGVYESRGPGPYTTKREWLNIRVKKETNGIRVSIKTAVEFGTLSVVKGQEDKWYPAKSDSITEGRILKLIESSLGK